MLSECFNFLLSDPILSSLLERLTEVVIGEGGEGVVVIGEGVLGGGVTGMSREGEEGYLSLF